MPKTVVARAHGKVNLHLGVGPLREDGYHELVTVFQSLDLHDTLRVSRVAESSTGIVARLSVDGPAEVPTDSSNLAWRAVEMVYQAHLARGGEELDPVMIHIEKGIPTAGGMAGGSADAAAALVAFNEFLPEPFGQEELLEFAAALGSDVPFTLLGETRLGTGRGEKLVPMLSRGEYHWALAFAKEGLSTPAVFAKLDEMEREPRMDVDKLSAALLSGDPQQVAAQLHNDMQAAALSLMPSLRKTLEAGRAAGALQAMVSGSGPTCAFLCEDAEQAREVAAELGLYGPTAVASGPAGGVEVLEVEVDEEE